MSALLGARRQRTVHAQGRLDDSRSEARRRWSYGRAANVFACTGEPMDNLHMFSAAYVIGKGAARRLERSMAAPQHKM